MTSSVCFSLLGVQKDAGFPQSRWDRWRPTVSLFQHDDLMIDRLELLAPKRHRKLADRISDDVRSVSPDTDVVLHEVDFRDPWDFAEVYAVLRDFADGYTFDEEGEDYLVHMTTGTHVAQICLFLLAETRHIPARLIQSGPPKGRAPGGEPEFKIIDLDLSRYDQLAARFEAERREGVSFLKAGIETRNVAFNHLMDRIEEVALASTAPILLTGPTGVGKTQLARRIHELKERGRQLTGAFVEANCATLRGDAAMSTLFGHEKGAFTGAIAKREGLLKSADGGLLFLDEIGELGLDEQAMLLRALEEGTFLPLGADHPIHSRFQLLAGTNRDLAKAVREGTFRDDLLARINLWTFTLPPLAERIEDLEPNLDYELARFAKESGRRVTFNKEARARFLTFAAAPGSAWRGNFRDFGAALTRLATLARGGRIGVNLVDEEVERLHDSWSALDDGAPTGLSTAILGQAGADELDLFDRVQLDAVLDVCRRSPSLSAAGRALFAESRKRRSSKNDADRLKKYLARFGLSWADAKA